MLRRRRSDVVSLDALDERAADAALADARHVGDPQAWLHRKIEDEEIRRTVLALPEPYRAVVLLRYMEELSYEAIAEALEIPLGTVKTLLHRARHRLRAALLPEGNRP
jgi:RNA polymerase sigma-70 factor (ECF subfamily)